MNLEEAICTRRSVRDFTADPVDEKTLTELIDAAIQAPSAVNQQPCSFCVVRDKALLTKISREAKAHMLKSSPVGLMSHHFQEILNDPNFDIFYGAPTVENLMLKARGIGLGTCWIGFAQAWLGHPRVRRCSNFRRHRLRAARAAVASAAP
jgi:nitroreductase